jgi:DeoR/GlpR family transcriptional regulator of sugar metabolism
MSEDNPRPDTILSSTRHRIILDALSASEGIRIGELIRRLGVSEETVRRDLRELEGLGMLRRVHGGAVPITCSEPSPLGARQMTLVAEKQRIAELALALAEGCENIFLAGGSTVLALARLLPAVAPLRVVTNMLDSAIAARQGRQHEVVLTGGTLSLDHHALYGSEVLEMVAMQRFDAAFVGVGAVDAERGCLYPNMPGHDLARALARSSAKIIVLADHTKFGGTARYAALGFGDVHCIVTDRRPGDGFVTELSASGTRVLFPEAG